MKLEEIDYWLKSFSNNNQSFMSKDGKKITLFKVFQELKELHFLLKIKNDYIKELEGYKHNLDRDYLRLEKENKELKERINKSIEYVRSNDIEVLKYHDIPSETTSYEIVTVDLLKILKGENKKVVSNNVESKR